MNQRSTNLFVNTSSRISGPENFDLFLVTFHLDQSEVWTSLSFFRMKKARNLFLLIFNQLHVCFSALTSSQHSVSCSESAENGIEMKIIVEKDFLEKNFPFRLQEFKEINGFYHKKVFQDQLEIEFEDKDCKFENI